MSSLTPFLMMIGKAEAAMALYERLIPGAKRISETRWGEGAPGGTDGQIMLAEMELAGTRVRFSDSPDVHDFSFTPSLSLFLTVDDRAMFDAVVAGLAEGGEVRMPADNYGFSERFAWVDDQFGVSWQINLDGTEGA